MKLYHGSLFIIKNPTVGGSKHNNDYGPAFYTTNSLDMAKLWALKYTDYGYVNEYNFNIEGLNILDLTDKKYTPLNWIAILMHFRTLDDSFKNIYKQRLEWLERNYYIDVSRYDLVIGFRADDAYFRFPREFIMGRLSYESLLDAYKLGELGLQYVLISEKSINRLKYIGSSIPEKNIAGLYKDVTHYASIEFDLLLNNSMENINSTSIIDLMRKKNG